MGEIAIVDSGGANIASLSFAIARLGHQTTLTTSATVIRDADRVLLPGVGAAKNAMERLAEADLIDVIRSLTQPVLGICLGMQLLCDASEEEDVDCLGIIPGIAAKMSASVAHPVPNMGWCSTKHRGDHSILSGVSDESYFYYLHSYALPVSDYALATAGHQREFSAIIAHRNFVATQFHPERSSADGARLLSNFIGQRA